MLSYASISMLNLSKNFTISNNAELLGFLACWKENKYQVKIARDFIRTLITRPHNLINKNAWEFKFLECDQLAKKFGVPTFSLMKPKKLSLKHLEVLKSSSVSTILVFFVIAIRLIPNKGSRIHIAKVAKFVGIHRRSIERGLGKLRTLEILGKGEKNKRFGRLYYVLEIKERGLRVVKGY